MSMIEYAEGIAVLTLHPPLTNELTGTLAELRNDDSLRVVILTGSGDAFNGGSDISELRELIESFPVPVIAAGAECELALACHLRVASNVEARVLAKQIADLAPLAIRACLKAVTEGLKLPFEEGLKLERELFASLFATEDAKEGTRAFLEKRPPIFKCK